jgi:nitric oxide reductase NorE protein
MEATANNKQSARAARHLPGEEGVWIFIFGDMMVFSLFFGVFMYYRSLDIAAFTLSQATLNQNYGAINTVLLLTSSWFVVLGLHAVKKNMGQLASRLFTAALLCGLGFAAIKFVEYGEKISAGYTLTSSDFFMYYYILTGIHFLHLIIGMGVLLFLRSKAKNPQLSAADIRNFESGTAYWHMVDLLWIVLFPLLYLVK